LLVAQRQLNNAEMVYWMVVVKHKTTTILIYSRKNHLTHALFTW
jgi:hypothetical protein